MYKDASFFRRVQVHSAYYRFLFISVITYSRSLLSRPRLTRITAYLEVKIWSPLKHENLSTGNKILWKRGAISPLFHNSFNISLTRSQISYTVVKCGCSIHFFLNLANLICRGTDISKYFRQSLGIRENEGRLYITLTYEHRVDASTTTIWTGLFPIELCLVIFYFYFFFLQNSRI